MSPFLYSPLKSGRELLSFSWSVFCFIGGTSDWPVSCSVVRMTWWRIALVALPPLTFLQGISFTSNERVRPDRNLCCVMTQPLAFSLPLSSSRTIKDQLARAWWVKIRWHSKKGGNGKNPVMSRLLLSLCRSFSSWELIWVTALVEMRQECSLRSNLKWSVLSPLDCVTESVR